MSTGFVVAVVVAVLIVAGARFTVRGLPLHGRTTRLTIAEAGLILIGSVTLAFHCGAMFFTELAGRLPGTDAVIHDIRALGTASLIWYAAPAGVVIIGLRRLSLAGLTAVIVALAAIGITMCDGGSLRNHLAAIFVGVLILAAVLAALVEPPRPAGRDRRQSGPVGAA